MRWSIGFQRCGWGHWLRFVVIVPILSKRESHQGRTKGGKREAGKDGDTHPTPHPFLLPPPSSCQSILPRPSGRRKSGENSPIALSPLLSLSTKAGNSNLDFNRGLLIISSATRATTSFSLGRARNRTYHFCVAHFEVGRAIRGRLGAYLCTDSAELIPASPI